MYSLEKLCMSEKPICLQYTKNADGKVILMDSFLGICKVKHKIVVTHGIMAEGFDFVA